MTGQCPAGDSHSLWNRTTTSAAFNDTFEQMMANHEAIAQAFGTALASPRLFDEPMSGLESLHCRSYHGGEDAGDRNLVFVATPKLDLPPPEEFVMDHSHLSLRLDASSIMDERWASGNSSALPDAHISIAAKKRQYRKDAEKKRRDSLKECFNEIQKLIPRRASSLPINTNLSRVISQEAILGQAVDYIMELQHKAKQKALALKELETAVFMLKNEI
ncbi:hypothetical protein BC830DRAFT_1112649 [Chytriomyces sp. MP71]|nr:hypothetical protein BC830DRAFT_1112649 [Chytriomyces sp. MP71]